MARILIATLPVAGHVHPMLPLSRRLVERGHEVCWQGGDGFEGAIERTGARHVPVRRHLASGGDYALPSVRWRRLRGIAQAVFYSHLFLDLAPGQLRDLADVLHEFPADLILTDCVTLGAWFFSERDGPPLAVYGMLPLDVKSCDTAPFGMALAPNGSYFGRLRNRALHRWIESRFFGDLTRHANAVRADVGLPPIRTFSDLERLPFANLFLQCSTTSFEYPRSDLPETVHFIGSPPPEPEPFEHPVWWDEIQEKRPVVHVTQGTLDRDPHKLLVPTLRALAREDVWVVGTTGGLPVDQVPLDARADNVRLAPFLPHAALLPYVDAMVTNGGFGGVRAALHHGVPLVAAGQTEEKAEVSARVAWSGVGIDLRTDAPSPARLRRAVRRVLRNPGYRAAARRVQSDFAKHDAADAASVLLETMVLTGRPVRRKTAPGPPANLA